MDNLSTGAQQVLDALADIGAGTVAEIRAKTGKTSRVTDKAVRELADTGLIVQTDPGDGTPARWSITAPATEPTSPDTATDTKPDPATHAAQDEVTDRGDADPINASVPGQLDQQDETNDLNTDPADNAHTDDTVVDSADQEGDGPGMPADDSQAGQVPARPKPPADRKVLAVAGVLGDYPHGATIDEIAGASGFNVGVVARLLQAMQQADAARHVPPDAEAGTPQRWQPGPGKASEVDPNPAPPRCHACGQVIRTSPPKAAIATARGGASGTVNSDGNEPLGRGVLRGWVLEFVNAHPGHEFTPGAIAEALGAQHGRTISSGAVLNNCRTLAMNDQIQAVRQDPFTVTANTPADTGSEQQ